jgi:predicted methyltransferase MtxX (methanogen marker protein 4)
MNLNSIGDFSVSATNNINLLSSGNITLAPNNLTGYLILNNLPTVATGLPSGAVWNDAGVLKIV